MLTATVRILQVGNRQVTLSMAKQLDRVHCSSVSPFGRIRLKGNLNDGWGEAEYLVIGSHKSTGELVVGDCASGRGYMDSGLRDWYNALPLLVLGGSR